MWLMSFSPLLICHTLSPNIWRTSSSGNKSFSTGLCTKAQITDVRPKPISCVIISVMSKIRRISL